MENQSQLNLIVEICNHCGRDVSIASGKYINRVPDFNDIFTRIDNNLDFPYGDFICEECDNNSMSND